MSAIQALGSADGYNMEYPEHLHIDYAKDAYRASNKRDYVEQMALWLQRQEGIHVKAAYHTWRQLRQAANMDSIHRRPGEGVDNSVTSSEGGAGDAMDRRGVPQLSGMYYLSCTPAVR